MATSIILKSHTTQNSDLERNAIKINEFTDDKTTKIRKPKIVTDPVVIKPNRQISFGSVAQFDINKYSGLVSGNDIHLHITIGATTASAGTVSYVGGYLMKLIKTIKFKHQGREIYKLDNAGIYQYYQRAIQERKSLMMQNARIGATGTDIDPAVQQEGLIYIPNPFIDFNPLRLDILQGNPYYEVEIAPLSEIASSSTAGASLSNTFIDVELVCNYMTMHEDDKRAILQSSMDASGIVTVQNEFVDSTKYLVSAGSTSITCDLPFDEVEYLSMYLSDDTTGAPFTGTPYIQEYHISVDNKNYPDTAISNKSQEFQQMMYFRKAFDKYIMTLRFSGLPSKDDDIESYGNVYGTMVLKEYSNPKLVVNFTQALPHNSTLNVFAYGRAWYRYNSKLGTINVEHKN